MQYLLGIDVGTTSTIGILLCQPDNVLGMASRPVKLSAPQNGWTEESPEQWWSNVGDICRQLLAESGVAACDIAGVGVTGMLPAVVLLDKENTLLRPSIQQSDGRSGAEVQQMRAEMESEHFLKRAGNGINQQLVGAKIRWLENNEPEIFNRIDTVFGSYDYINWKLTGQKNIEQNWALEAGFVNVSTHLPDDELIAFAHLPRHAVPPMVSSHEVIGKITPDAADFTGLHVGTPVIAGAADMIASALGAGVTSPGDVLIKFGGAVDILTVAETINPDPRLYLDYHLVPGYYMPNGCMSTGGSGLNWFIQNFALQYEPAAHEKGMNIHQYLDFLADDRPAGSDGLLFLPYLLGEKTPLHDPNARGILFGLTLSHNIGHMWRAVLESYAYAIRHHIETLQDIGYPAKRFIVSDGGSASKLWMQIVADVVNQPLTRLEGHPGSCLGAAWAAAMGVGVAKDWKGASAWVKLKDIIEPQSKHAAIYRHGYQRFRQLYEACLPLTEQDEL